MKSIFRLSYLTATLLLLCFAIFYFYQQIDASSQNQSRSSETSSAPNEVSNSLDSEVSKINKPRTKHETVLDNDWYNEKYSMYKNYSNLFTLMKILLPEAEAGDDNSKHILMKIYTHCSRKTDIETFVKELKLASELPEAHPDYKYFLEYQSSKLEKGPYSSFEKSYIDRIFLRCSEFTQDDLSNPELVSVLTKVDGLVPEEVYSFTHKPQVSITGLSTIKKAVLSKQPESLFFLGRNGYLSGNLNAAAWVLLACDYGYDCSEGALEKWVDDVSARCGASYHHPTVCGGEISLPNYLQSIYTKAELNSITKLKIHYQQLTVGRQLDKLSVNFFHNDN